MGVQVSKTQSIKIDRLSPSQLIVINHPDFFPNFSNEQKTYITV